VKRPRALLLIAAVVVVVATAGGFFVWRMRGPRPIRIAGKTISSDGRPLGDVRVTLEVAPDDTEEEGAVERAETLSDEKGEFSIEYQSRWKTASYRLDARKAGYRDLSIGSAESLKPPVILRLAPAGS
jgi:hypothetical protein